MTSNKKVIAVVPAAGVGKRMKAHCPKQYLLINGKTVLEHTIEKLLSTKNIDRVVVAISDEDEYFAQTSLSTHPRVIRVSGGKERVDSVLSGLKSISCEGYQWVLVHDAARPCVAVKEIEQLISICLSCGTGGLLAYPAKDTMKKAASGNNLVDKTVDRANLWHALTPQMYLRHELLKAIQHSVDNQLVVTDESSAIEAIGKESQLIEASSENIKITRPDDLVLASFILTKQQEKLCV